MVIFSSIIGIFTWSNLPSRTVTLGSTRSLTEMSTMEFPGDIGRPASKADNLTLCVSRRLAKYKSLDVSQRCGPPRLVTVIALGLYRLLAYLCTSNVFHYPLQTSCIKIILCALP
jgi:hypothetical protein